MSNQRRLRGSQGQYNPGGGGGGGSGVSEIIAGPGISIDQGTGVVTISAAAAAPTDYATATNNSGNTTITPTVAIQTFALSIGGSARTSIIILATAGRLAGDKIFMDLALPATTDIILEFRNATSAGTLLLPAATFASQQYATNGFDRSLHVEFTFTGSAWRYDVSTIPA